MVVSIHLAHIKNDSIPSVAFGARGTKERTGKRMRQILKRTLENILNKLFVESN